MFLCVYAITFVPCVLMVNNVNKYSADANIPKKNPLKLDPEINVRTVDKPYRMAKLNMLWSKAQVRLTEPKLRSLFLELKIHDKEEVAWKHLKAQGLDKEGLKEAEMRHKLIGIMSTYDLLEHFDDVSDPSKIKAYKEKSDSSDTHLNKSMFKDKKLNKLWEKAEHSGFTAEELQALKEEFNHHQEKIDQYYALLSDTENRAAEDHKNSLDDKLDRFNEIQNQEEEPDVNYVQKANELRDKHRDIRDSFDRLHRLSVKGPKNEEFVEPKVQGLWRLAQEAKFTPDELESLKVELLHYEKRLLKLRHLQLEAALDNSHKNKKLGPGDKVYVADVMDDAIKKHARKVEKIHIDLEARIMQKHIEL